MMTDIPFYSLCEHHLLPFFGTVAIAYIPKNGRIIGLSKLPRLVDFVSQRPNVQEGMTAAIVAELTRILDPKGIAVVVKARHMCVEMRGIRRSNTETVTNRFAGQFLNATERQLILQQLSR